MRSPSLGQQFGAKARRMAVTGNAGDFQRNWRRRTTKTPNKVVSGRERGPQGLADSPMDPLADADGPSQSADYTLPIV